MRKINASFNAAFISEAGSYLNNNDYYACAEMDDFACYVLADGIDDDQEYKSAEIAVTNILKQFTLNPTMKKGDLKAWLKEINRELLNLGRLMRLKASITVVVTDYINMVYAQAGNTRLVLYRQGSLFHTSPDHSLTSTYLKEGKISADKVATHIERANLSVYLGQPTSFSPFISDSIKLAEGDTLLLFTKGIWENIDTGELTDIVADAKVPQDILDNTEEMLLSKQPLRLDNYTLVALFIDKIYEDPLPAKRKALIKKIFFACIPVLIILIIFGIVYYFRQERKKEDLEIMAGHIATAMTLSTQANYARAAEEYKAALDIARKYKLPGEQKDLDNYFRTAELIVAADSSFQQGDLLNSAQKYQLAADASYFADYLGAEHINKQQNIVNSYMLFTELLETGDTHLEEKEYKEARETYLSARTIAAKIYFTDGRKEATAKLNELNLVAFEANKVIKEEEAAAYEREADKLTLFKQYDSALSQLKLAAAIYSQVKSPDKFKGVESKINLLDLEIAKAQQATADQVIAQEAAAYEEQGDFMSATDFEGALGNYGLALQIYNKLGKADKIPIVQAKMDNLNARKVSHDKLVLQQKASEIERAGDLEAAKAAIENARRNYAYAQQLYATAGLTLNVDLLQKKHDQLAVALNEYEMKKLKAQNYLDEADAQTQQGIYVPAHYNYLLAKDLYRSLNLPIEEKTVDERIKILQQLAGGRLD
ncbi:MAG: SpoIIE family protein phosphatase [Sporomusaceae bacterium]|jgi:serine/threonine protein phosphatase PrpC|nr:SpoIIE family protein phosphatase [Sporomusaceae bacterium]